MSGGDTDFNKCLDFVLAQEGGYSITPGDPGGPTNMGITLETFLKWRDMPASRDDLGKLTRQEAAEIYKKKFWNPCRCEALPRGIALAVFDAAVNSGVNRSVSFLQSALGISQDGICGEGTILAARSGNISEIIHGAIAARLAFLKCLPTWEAFGTGWTHRCVRVEEEALRMSVGRE